MAEDLLQDTEIGLTEAVTGARSEAEGDMTTAEECTAEGGTRLDRTEEITMIENRETEATFTLANINARDKISFVTLKVDEVSRGIVF